MSTGLVYPFYSDVDSIYLNFYKSNVLDVVKDIDTIIIPVEADKTVVSQMEHSVLRETTRERKNILRNEFDLYTGGYFFKDFVLKIPRKEKYTIFFRKESILSRNKNVQIQIGDTVIEQKNILKNKNSGNHPDWVIYNQVDIQKGEYPLELFVNGEKVEAVNQQDILFVAENLLSDFEIPTLEYTQVSPSKYVVNIVGASENFPLIFSETYHPGWKMFVEKNLRTASGTKFISENNQGTIQNNNLDQGKFYDIFSRQPSLDENHFQINNFANAWWVDVSQLEKDGKITKNIDGTYDFSVTLEFEPQKYFYIGLAISGFTLMSCLSYLLYKLIVWLYNRPQKSSSSFDE